MVNHRFQNGALRAGAATTGAASATGESSISSSRSSRSIFGSTRQPECSGRTESTWGGNSIGLGGTGSGTGTVFGSPSGALAASRPRLTRCSSSVSMKPPAPTRRAMRAESHRHPACVSVRRHSSRRPRESGHCADCAGPIGSAATAPVLPRVSCSRSDHHS